MRAMRCGRTRRQWCWFTLDGHSWTRPLYMQNQQLMATTSPIHWSEVSSTRRLWWSDTWLTSDVVAGDVQALQVAIASHSGYVTQGVALKGTSRWQPTRLAIDANTA